ncbi:MAG: glucose 1-dehydrogenase [Acetobacteraceae bacterium]|nr:glucose 1-dehydrogenase [Acetobacteraceae bacterium]
MIVDLAGQVAIVTGAAGAIGGAIARAYAANGATVVINDLSRERAEEAAAELPDALGLGFDIADEEAVEQAVASVLDRFGRIDILVNNAGVNTMAHRVTLEQFPTAEWHRIIDVDLHGTFLVSRAVARAMVERGAGCIINVSSIAGLVPLRLQSPFVAAKAAVAHLTKSMALEFGPRGLRVNAIAPGSTLSEGTRRLFYSEDGSFSSRAREMLAHVPLGRPGNVEEIAAGALFLADPESDGVNGHVLTIDGGWTAGFNM